MTKIYKPRWRIAWSMLHAALSPSARRKRCPHERAQPPRRAHIAARAAAVPLALLRLGPPGLDAGVDVDAGHGRRAAPGRGGYSTARLARHRAARGDRGDEHSAPPRSHRGNRWLQPDLLSRAVRGLRVRL